MASFRGAASTGTSVPVSTRAPIGAHRCFPIIAQDFSPGLPCGPAGYDWPDGSYSTFFGLNLTEV